MILMNGVIFRVAAQNFTCENCDFKIKMQNLHVVSILVSVDDGVNSALTTLTTDMGTDHTDLIIESDSVNYPFQLNGPTTDGGRQYIYYGLNRMHFYTQETGNVYSDYMYNSSMENNMKQSEPFDPFVNTDLGNQGVFLAVTPNTGRNTSTPFFMHVMHIKNSP